MENTQYNNDGVYYLVYNAESNPLLLRESAYLVLKGTEALFILKTGDYDTLIALFTDAERKKLFTPRVALNYTLFRLSNIKNKLMKQIKT